MADWYFCGVSFLFKSYVRCIGEAIEGFSGKGRVLCERFFLRHRLEKASFLGQNCEFRMNPIPAVFVYEGSFLCEGFPFIGKSNWLVELQQDIVITLTKMNNINLVCWWYVLTVQVFSPLSEYKLPFPQVRTSMNSQWVERLSRISCRKR